METQPLDVTQCYGVYLEQEGQRRQLILTPGYQVSGEGPKREITEFVCLFGFIQGMEFELERYLRWIDHTALLDRYGKRKGELYVEKKPCRDLQQEMLNMLIEIPDDQKVITQILMSPAESYAFNVWHTLANNNHSKSVSKIF